LPAPPMGVLIGSGCSNRAAIIPLPKSMLFWTI
jgi:hypothetical protein